MEIEENLNFSYAWAQQTLSNVLSIKRVNVRRVRKGLNDYKNDVM